MKKKILVYITIVIIFSFNCFAQIVQVDITHKKAIDSQINILTRTTTNSIKTTKKYQVVETVYLKFGGYTTTYIVPDLKLINTFDLGPNNTRVITILYNTIEQQTTILNLAATKSEPINPILFKNIDTPKINLNAKTTTDSPKKTGDYVYVDVLKTYERMSEKGYKSIDILKKVCNVYFFDDQLQKAAKCYDQLFSLTTNLEPEFYYRYSISLKAIDEDEKASFFLKKYNQLSGNQNE